MCQSSSTLVGAIVIIMTSIFAPTCTNIGSLLSVHSMDPQHQRHGRSLEITNLEKSYGCLRSIQICTFLHGIRRHSSLLAGDERCIISERTALARMGEVTAIPALYIGSYAMRGSFSQC